MFGFVGDVAGKFAEAEGELPTEIEERADENQDAAEDEKRTTDFAEVHVADHVRKRKGSV